MLDIGLRDGGRISSCPLRPGGQVSSRTELLRTTDQRQDISIERAGADVVAQAEAINQMQRAPDIQCAESVGQGVAFPAPERVERPAGSLSAPLPSVVLGLQAVALLHEQTQLVLPFGC